MALSMYASIIERHLIDYIVAIAGWADHGAGAAGKALFRKFIPDRAVMVEIHEIGHENEINGISELAVSLCSPGNEFLYIAVSKLFIEKPGCHSNEVISLARTYPDKIALIKIGNGKVKSFLYDVRSCGFAQAIGRGSTGEGNDGAFFASFKIIRILVLLPKDTVKDEQGVYLTCGYTVNDTGSGYLLRFLIESTVEIKHLKTGGDKELFYGEKGGNRLGFEIFEVIYPVIDMDLALFSWSPEFTAFADFFQEFFEVIFLEL